MGLNKESFRFLTESELREATDIARREVKNTNSEPRQSTDAWLAQCWTEGIFSSMIKSGYTIILKKDNKEITLVK